MPTKIVIKEPGKNPRLEKVEDPYDEARCHMTKPTLVKAADDIGIVCDASSQAEPYNFTLGMKFNGTVLFVSHKDGYIDDIDYSAFKKLFSFLYEVDDEEVLKDGC